MDVEHLPGSERGSVEHVVGVDINHIDSRFEINAAHTRHVERLGTDQLQGRTSVNVGTGLAFADGHVAVGRPVRGAFAIVGTHESLATSDVHLDPFENTYRAAADGLGPLIVSDLSPYSPTKLAYEVDNLPAGYDVGSGSFDFVAPYKAGFALSIGSDSAVTALGVLKDAESPLRRRMIEDMTVRNLSPMTQRSYLHAVEGYSRYFGRSPDRLDFEDAPAYQVHLAGKCIAWRH